MRTQGAARDRRCRTVDPAGRGRGPAVGVGIDAEPHAALPGEVRDFILRNEERAPLRSLSDARPDLHWDRIVFCAKEAVYKAWFPLTRQWLDFVDVSVDMHLSGSFTACLRVRRPGEAGALLDALRGRWMVGRGLVVAAASVGPHALDAA